MKAVWTITRDVLHRMLVGGLWFFEWKLLSLVKFIGIGDISDMNFKCVSFWVRICNVLLECVNEGYTEYWVRLLGCLKILK